MPSTATLLAFTAATLALVAIPGPNLPYIVGTGIGSGGAPRWHRRSASKSARWCTSWRRCSDCPPY